MSTSPNLRSRDPEDREVRSGDRKATREKMMDKTIADSFPASDPPSSLPDPNEDSFKREIQPTTEKEKGGEMIKLKRVYEPATPDDGVRILVERLWPRGIRKDALKLDTWLKDVAPSDKLRRWFGHEPKKWNGFRDRYFAELDGNPQAWESVAKAARRGRVTLIYSSHDTEHNNAVALKDYIQDKIQGGHSSHKLIA